MKIRIQTIPHDSQRYPTCGDWQVGEDGSISIDVSEMGNDDYAFLVGIHEAIEVWLCRKRGISQEEVDAFDINYEEKRQDGDVSEPGDDTNSPYFCEHQFATQIERMLARELRVNWSEYSKAVESL